MTKMTNRIVSVFVVALLTLAASAVAGPGDTTKASGQSYLSGTESSSESIVTPLTDGLFPSMTKVILVLLGVIVAIYFTLSIVKKVMGRRATGGGRGDVIEVIETCYLAPKQSITLVRIGERGALLGVTEKGINPLIELTSEEMLATEEQRHAKNSPIRFKDALGKARQKIVDLGNYGAKLKRKDRSAIGV